MKYCGKIIFNPRASSHKAVRAKSVILAVVWHDTMSAVAQTVDSVFALDVVVGRVWTDVALDAEPTFIVQLMIDACPEMILRPNSNVVAQSSAVGLEVNAGKTCLFAVHREEFIATVAAAPLRVILLNGEAIVGHAELFIVDKAVNSNSQESSTKWTVVRREMLSLLSPTTGLSVGLLDIFVKLTDCRSLLAGLDVGVVNDADDDCEEDVKEHETREREQLVSETEPADDVAQYVRLEVDELLARRRELLRDDDARKLEQELSESIEEHVAVSPSSRRVTPVSHNTSRGAESGSGPRRIASPEGLARLCRPTVSSVQRERRVPEK